MSDTSSMARGHMARDSADTSISRYLKRMMAQMPAVIEEQEPVAKNDLEAVEELLAFVNPNVETLFTDFEQNERLKKMEEEIRTKTTYPKLYTCMDFYAAKYPVEKLKPALTGSLEINGASIVPTTDAEEEAKKKKIADGQSFAQELTNMFLHIRKQLDSDAKPVDLVKTKRVESGPIQIYSFFPDTLLDFIGKNIQLFDKTIDPNDIKEEDVPCVHLKGACMLADISGFSKFSGEMCAQGLSGLDKLTEVTNGFLGDYVKTVYQYRGDVIAFAGDALICLFRVEPDLYGHSLLSPNCCTRALQCSKILQHLKTDRLSTHLAISFGEMKIALLGGVDDKWAYIMNGACIAEIGDAVDYAKAEETACTQACFEHSMKGRNAAMTGEYASHIGTDNPPGEFELTFDKVGPDSETSQIYKLKDVDTCAFNHIKTGRESVELTSCRNGLFKQITRTMEIVARFIPSPVLSAVCDDSLGDISELRQVTTIFLSLDSYDPKVHQDPRSLQPFFTISQQLLLETGGFLRQFLVDDKGCVLIAMWGVPSVSYSNNTVRAVYFAVNLRKRAEKEIGMMCSIGVTTGSVFCGWVGSTTRRDYAGVGTQVNVAARLMCKAKGRVLIDPDSYRNLDPTTKAQCEAAESLTLKGIAYPVVPHYFKLDLEPSMTNVKKPAIVGALYTLKASIKKIIDKDITQFGKAAKTQDSFEKNYDKPKCKIPVSKPRSRKERQSLIVVAGPSGSGKGMVAKYFQDGMTKKKFIVHYLKCRSTQKAIQYGMIRELLMDVIGHDTFTSDALANERIHDLVKHAHTHSSEDEREHARSRLRYLLEVKVDGEDLSRHRKPNPSDDTIPRILAYLLRNNAQTAFILEDAHNCDEMSWKEIYSILLKKEISIMVLVTVKSLDQEKVLSSIVAMCMTDFDKTPSKTTTTDSGGSGEKKSNAFHKKVDMNIDMFGDDDDETLGKKKPPEGILATINRDSCTSIDMSGLNDSQVKEIVTAKLQTKDVSSDLLKLVMDLSSGNAFWCEAIAEFLEEKGMEDFEAEMKKNIEHKEQALQTIIVCRIEKLSAHQQYVLKYASVIGIEFNQKILQSILPQKYGKDLKDTMEHLSEGGFITCMEEASDASVYEFANPIIQSTVYELLPHRLLKEIHVLVGKAMEEQYKSAIQGFFPFLAYHFGMNESTSYISYKYKLKAADQAIALGAYADGIFNIQEARPLAKTLPEFNICSALLENLILDINEELRDQRKIINIQKIAEEDDDKTQSLLTFKREVEEIVTSVLLNMEEKSLNRGPDTEMVVMPDWNLTYLQSQTERIKRSREGDSGCCLVM